MQKFFKLKIIKKLLGQKKLYLYGAASNGFKVALLLQSLGINKKNLYFIDSDLKKKAKLFMVLE